MNADFLGIPGYRPEWVCDPVRFRAEHENSMRRLMGHKVSEWWVAWDLKYQDVSDGPVVLVADDGFQVEICCWKADEMSVTYNTIDVTSRDCWTFGGLLYEWRRNALPELASVVGREVDSVAVVECGWGHGAEREWCLDGLDLGLSGPQLAIVNGGDRTWVQTELRLGPNQREQPWLPASTCEA